MPLPSGHLLNVAPARFDSVTLRAHAGRFEQFWFKPGFRFGRLSRFLRGKVFSVFLHCLTCAQGLVLVPVSVPENGSKSDSPSSALGG